MSLVSGLASLLPGGGSTSQGFSIKNETTGAVVLKGVTPARINIKISSIPMRHMREDGTTIVDSRIIQPTTVSVEAFCPDIPGFIQTLNLLTDRSAFYTMSSKGLILTRLMCDSDQTKQSSEMMSALPIRLTFKRVLAKDTKPKTTSQATNASLISRGMSLVSSVSSAVQNVTSLVSKVSSIASTVKSIF